MAHLICDAHKLRSIVTEDKKIIHRNPHGKKCTAARVRYRDDTLLPDHVLLGSTKVRNNNYTEDESSAS